MVRKKIRDKYDLISSNFTKSNLDAFLKTARRISEGNRCHAALATYIDSVTANIRHKSDYAAICFSVHEKQGSLTNSHARATQCGERQVSHTSRHRSASTVSSLPHTSAVAP